MKVCSHVSSHKNNNMTSMASQACSGASWSLWRFKFMGANMVQPPLFDQGHFRL